MEGRRLHPVREDAVHGTRLGRGASHIRTAPPLTSRSFRCRYEAKHEGKRDAKRKGGEGGGAPKPKRIQVGTSELSRLWNLGGNSLEEIAAGAAAKQSVPGLVEYLQPVLEQMDPAEGIEEEYAGRVSDGARLASPRTAP